MNASSESFETKLQERIRKRLEAASFSRQLDRPSEIINLGGKTAISRLRELGIEVSNSTGGTDHYFMFMGNPHSQRSLKVSIQDGARSILMFRPDDRLTGNFVLAGWDTIFVTEGAPTCPGPVNLNVHSFGHDNLIFWGKGSTSVGTTIVAEGGCEVIVEDDSMFAQGVKICSSDNHAIIDLSTDKIVNPPRSVRIGRHVWLGHDVLILKGTTVGCGSVVSARSVVGSNVPAGTIVAGFPARVVREGIAWTRNPSPTPDEIAAAKIIVDRNAISSQPVPLERHSLTLNGHRSSEAIK